MSQTRYIKYKESITSFEANEKYMGILAPTVYKGFDRITASELDISILHDQTGEEFTKKDGSLTFQRGVWVTRQGLVVKEDGIITIPTEVNPNTLPRYDLLVGEHEYDELSAGGLPAVYKILKGTTAGFPSYNSYQTPIAELVVPGKNTDALGITYKRVRTPQLGGKFSAILNEVNSFKNQVHFTQGVVDITTETVNGNARQVIKLLDGANTFLVGNATAVNYLDLLPNLPNGTELNLVFTKDCTIRQMKFQRVSVSGSVVTLGYSDGYRPLSFSSFYPDAELPVKRGDVVTVVKTSNPGAVVPFNEYWSVTSHSALPALLEALKTTVITDRGVLDVHMSNKANPHEVTKAQVGLGNIPNAIGTTLNWGSADAEVLATMAALKLVDTKANTANSNIGAHTARTDNPHGVTKAQIGLGNLPNKKSDLLTLDDSESLATSKALKKLSDETPRQIIGQWVPEVEAYKSSNDELAILNSSRGFVARTGNVLHLSGRFEFQNTEDNNSISLRVRNPIFVFDERAYIHAVGSGNAFCISVGDIEQQDNQALTWIVNWDLSSNIYLYAQPVFKPQVLGGRYMVYFNITMALNPPSSGGDMIEPE